MSEQGDAMRQEMTRLRADVNHLLSESAATRELANLADRDTSEMRVVFSAQRTVLNALRANQIEHGRALNTLALAVGGLTTQVGTLSRHVDTLTTRVNTLDTKVDTLTTRLGSLADGQAEHTRILTEHGVLLAEILHRLPDPSGGKSGQGRTGPIT